MSTQKNTTKSNILFNMTYQVLVMILPFITAPYISRVLGAEGIGQYTYTYSIANYFVLFAQMGLANYGNRSIAKVRDSKDKLNKEFSSIYTMQTLFSTTSLIIYLIFIFVIHNQYFYIALLQTLYVSSAMFDVSWFFYGIEKFKMIVIRSGIIKICTTLCIFVFVKEKEDIWIYTLILSLGYFISSFYLWINLSKYVSYSIPEKDDVIRHIKPNVILFIPVIAVSLYHIMDKIMIGFIGSMVDTGLYENADRLVTIPLTIVTSIGTVMMPKMSNLCARGEAEKSSIFIRDSMQLVMALSIGMAFGMAAIAERFVPLYYGEDFRASTKLVIYLTPIIVFTSIACVIRTQYLIPKEKDKQYIFSVIAGAVINFIINISLISSLGPMGAVLGTLAAEFIVMFIQCFAVRRELDFIRFIRDSWFFLVAGFSMYILIKRLEDVVANSFIGIFIEILIGIVIYMVISWIFLYIIDKRRLRYLFKTILK